LKLEKDELLDTTKQHIPIRHDPAFNSEVLQKLWQQALATLQSLQSPLGLTASGPDDHFHAIFGRDSLWSVLFSLEAAPLLQAATVNTDDALVPGISVTSYLDWLHNLAVTVLRGLAQLQGKVVNDVNEEQPGRIIHEYWNPVPARMIEARWPVADGAGRYYGSFDATFLYLVTLERVVSFFHDSALLEELWPNAEAVLRWMLAWSDLDHDGIVEYTKRNPAGIGLDNEVWKDSGESIQSPDHRPIKHPVAWVEVQGYAWAAYSAYLTLANKRQSLETGLEQEIRVRMDKLQAGLARFWFNDQLNGLHYPFPAMALDGNKQAIPVVSTNPGHLLWSGCLSKAQANQLCTRLMLPDILTPWGLRTLSEQAFFYNPLSYHCGAIWPFDNVVITIGLRHYGFQQEALRVAEPLLQALHAFDKPVELYTVQPSRWIRSHHLEQDWFLADYFYACDVQAWTAAAILYFTALLM
jgi:glycogen debranching enzyme